MNWKDLIRSVVPPVFVETYRALRWGDYWRGIYASFREVPKRGDGFESPAYFRPTIADTKAAMRAAASWRTVPGHVVEEDAFLPLIASLIAEQNGGRLRILDFGGGAGISFIHLASGMARPSNVEYHVVELDWACAAGRELFADDPRIQFHSDLPVSLPNLDVVLLKGVLMSIEDYAGLLRRLCGYRARFLFFINVAVGAFQTFASAQHNLPGIIPHWFFNRDEIVQILAEEGYAPIFRGALMEKYRQKGLPESHRLENGKASVLLFALRP